MKKDILSGLNKEQLKAVTFKDKPLLIVAGAGTGKTRVITHRIAYLIKKESILPSNVLALTFSKKASFEMLERVEGLIEEYKDELWVMTFHSFCHRILTEHALEAGLSRGFKLLGRIEAWIFLKDLLPKLNLKYYLNLADPTYPIHSLLKFIGRAKDELVSPEDYRAYSESIKDKEERSRSLELAGVYEAYEKGLFENGLLDFGDLITMAMKLLRENGMLLEKYRDKFKYILVDEFQDTNVAQIELVSLLAQKHRAISVVGDDDQGIYRFRGASYASFLKFKEKFEEAATIRLSQNYRSTKRILKISDCLIKHNGLDRFDPEKSLWSCRSERSGSVEGPKALELKSNGKEAEAQTIVDEIKALVKKGADYSDIAILYRAHSHKDHILELLKSEKLPCVVSGKLGIFAEAIVKDMIAMLRAVEDPHDNVSLFRVLSMPFSGIGLRELVEITRHAKRNSLAIFEVLKDAKSAEPPLRGTLAQFKLKPVTIKAISHFINFNDELLKRSYKEDTKSLLYFMLEETAHIKDGDDKSKQAFGRFMGLMDDYLEREGDQSLSAFLKYLDAFMKAGGDVEEDEPGDGSNGVRLLTVHQAKGLEFEYVFVIGLNQSKFPTRKRGDEIAFPIELMKEKLPEGDFHLQEERRLFYVALTRAREKLYLSSLDGPYMRPSVFLKEIESKSDIEERIIEEKSVAERSLPGGGKDGMAFKRVKGRVAEPAYISIDMAAPPSYSFSQLETYTLCPLKYKFSYVIGIPPVSKPHLIFGSLMHETLERFFLLIKDKGSATKDELLQLYEGCFDVGGFKNVSQQDGYRKEGMRILDIFYEKNKGDLKPPLYLEEEFLLKIGGRKLKGIIDRIDRLDDGGCGSLLEEDCEIIDYKTGSAKDQAEADKNLQLSIYAIAAKELLGLNPKILSFYNLTTNEKVSSERSEDALLKAKEKVLGVISKIEERLFDANPGRHCRWCDFIIVCPYEKK